jgi:hypothetical protein
MTTQSLKATIAAAILLFVCIGAVTGTTITAHGGTIPSTGATGEFPITVDSLPGGLSGFLMTISLSDPSKAEITTAITPSWADISLIGGNLVTGPNEEQSVMADSVVLAIATFNDNFYPAPNLTLVTLKIKGDAEGSTGLQISDVDIQDKNGNTINAVVQNGTIIVGAPPTTPPTTVPTTGPTTIPTTVPITEPTTIPTTAPTTEPTTVPTTAPTTEPTTVPTTGPTTESTTVPTTVPTTEPPSSTTGSLDITSIPSDAKVYLDDVYKGRTSLLITNLDPGAYMLRIEKEGYNSWYQGITIVAGEKTFITAPLTPIPTTNPTATPTPTFTTTATGGLFVVSEPTATVFIDGMEKGKSNEPIDKVPSGMRNVTLFKAGYIPKSIMVNIPVARVTVTQKIILEPGIVPTTNMPTSEETTTVTTAPTTAVTTVPTTPGPNPPVPVSGGIFVYSVPFGCSVFIDDVYRGTSPNLFSAISPGTHNLKITLPGYEEVDRSVPVYAGDITMVTVMMTPDFSALISALS